MENGAIFCGKKPGAPAEGELLGFGTGAPAGVAFTSSPDNPETQQKFAASRGWRFPMVSHQGSSFAADMGYRGEDGSWHPGLSSFRMDDGRITRIATTPMGPFDDYCAIWHMFNLLQDGPDGWQPQFKYDQSIRLGTKNRAKSKRGPAFIHVIKAYLHG